MLLSGTTPIRACYQGCTQQGNNDTFVFIILACGSALDGVSTEPEQ